MKIWRARRVEAAVDALDERRARGEREQLGQVVRERRADADRAVGAVDADVDMEAEGVVAPDDVAEELVVAAVVRRVDDPLLLPRAPRMRSGRCQRDAERLHELAELPAPLAQLRGRVRERVAAAGADLDLRRDQLADEVRLELRPPRRFLQLLEAVDQVERLGVEERELLLDGDREIRHGVERLAREREHLLVPKPLLVAHARKPTYALGASLDEGLRASTPDACVGAICPPCRWI